MPRQIDADASGSPAWRFAGLEAQLVQPGARTHQDGEGLGRDLHIERPLIALGDVVEAGAAIGQQAHEDVDPAGRGFGVGAGDQALGQAQPLLQLGDIDAALFQHIAARQVDRMHGHVGDAVGDQTLARQEGGAHAPGAVGQAQVQAGRLHLIGVEGGLRGDRARAIRVSMDWQGRIPASPARIRASSIRGSTTRP
jgi:hypothetical protein